MEISEDRAKALCREVVERLAEWTTFPALLQVGGIESRGASRILLALEKWLDSCHPDPRLLIVPEYRLSRVPSVDETTDKVFLKAADELFGGGRIDYAFVTKSSIGKAALSVDTVMEVKTNYLGQTDLRLRPKAACDQALRYGNACGALNAYVLYIVAMAVGKVPDESGKDAGWRYWNPKVKEPIGTKDVRVLGFYPAQLPEVSAGATGFQIWAYLLAPKDA